MNKKSQSRILNRVLIELKTYSFKIFISLICALATVYLTLRIPILTGQAVDCIVAPGQIDYDRLIQVLKIMTVTIAATFSTQWIMNRVNNDITYSVTKSSLSYST